MGGIVILASCKFHFIRELKFGCKIQVKYIFFKCLPLTFVLVCLYNFGNQYKFQSNVPFFPDECGSSKKSHTSKNAFNYYSTDGLKYNEVDIFKGVF